MSYVLVIDDDPLFRRLIESAVGKDHNVETAADGHEGYQAALKQPPRLVVLDLLMPTWDGVQTMRAFRSDDKLSGVPVVLLTGSEDEPEIAEVRSLGVSAVLLKTGFSADGLREAVNAAISHAAAAESKRVGGTIPVARQRFDD